MTGRDELRGVIKVDGEDLLTTARAAEELGVTASTLRTMIQQGKLAVKRLHARSVLIPRSEVEGYRQIHLGRRGRRRKGGKMGGFSRKSLATTPEGRRVLVSTVGNPIARESMVFPTDEANRVASTMHLLRVRHGPEDDLDAAHENLIVRVETGEAVLEDREATQAEVEEAMADLLLLAKTTLDDLTIGGGDEMAH